jgi:hypothetical protein
MADWKNDGTLLTLGAVAALATATTVGRGSFARNSPLAVGDRVQYKAEWLRSTGSYTGPLGFAKGVVTKIDNYGKKFAIATIDWGDDEIPPRVNVGNLKRIKDTGLDLWLDAMA